MRAKDGFLFILTEQPSSNLKKHQPEWKDLPFALFGDGREFFGKLSSSSPSSSTPSVASSSLSKSKNQSSSKVNHPDVSVDSAVVVLDSFGKELFSWTGGAEMEELSEFPSVEQIAEHVAKK